MVEERDGGLEGTRNWRRSAVWLGCVCGRTGLLFWGDAKLAHSAVWLGCVCGRTGLLFWGDAELARKRDSAGCVCEFVGRMIYIQAGQSLTSRACSTVGGAN